MGYYLDNLTEEQLEILEEEAERELTERYWSYALDLIYAWGDYLRTKKLYINASYSETEHKVKNVVEKQGLLSKRNSQCQIRAR